MPRFLAQEKPNTHMHIGALALFEGEPPALDEFLAHIESRLHLVPRYRQKLATPPLETGRPLWVDDPTFNLAYHVRHTRSAGARRRGRAAGHVPGACSPSAWTAPSRCGSCGSSRGWRTAASR